MLTHAEDKAVGIIVISTDRGLAGGLNANVFKQTLLLAREWQDKGAQVSLCVFGTKGLNFFRRLSLPILANAINLGDRPQVKDLVGTVKVMLDAYAQGSLDRLFLVNAQFVNTMTQKPEVVQLLPLEPLDTDRPAGALGLHLRAGGVGHSRWPAAALPRIARLPRRGRERRLRDGGAHGGDGCRLGQCRQTD